MSLFPTIVKEVSKVAKAVPKAPGAPRSAGVGALPMGKPSSNALSVTPVKAVSSSKQSPTEKRAVGIESAIRAKQPGGVLNPPKARAPQYAMTAGRGSGPQYVPGQDELSLQNIARSAGATVKDVAAHAFPQTEVVKRGAKAAIPLEKAEREGKNVSAGATISPVVINPSNAISTRMRADLKALGNEPVGTVKHTVSSLPNIASSLAGEGLRLGEETGLGAAKLAGAKIPKGEGEPLKTIGEFGKSALASYGRRYGESEAAMQKEAEKEGVAPEVLDAASVGLPAGAIAGRLLSKGIEASKYGAKEFAAQSAARDAAIVAHQHPAMHEFLEGGPKGQGFTIGAKPPKLSRTTRAKAFVHETAAQPRPNLRVAPGSEAPKVERGAAVGPQVRSPNFFRAASQSTLDNARRSYQLHGLERVGRERADFLANYPNLHHDSVPVSYAQHLATLTGRGEVTPLFQKGGLNLGKFVGAEKAQRVGTSYPGADLRRAGEAARSTVASAVKPALGDLSPTQRKLVVLAKEGHFPLHDPAKAQSWLEEISRQAHEAGTQIPLAHKMTGSDVARQVDAALTQMKAKGADSVITPDFQKLVETIPDERLVSPKDPLLKQIPDEVAARRYLPQQQTLDAWAKHQIQLRRESPSLRGDPTHIDAISTERAVAQIHQKLEAGKDLRALARKSSVSKADNLHRKADNLFAEAKNLADENAKRHGMPTDRTYIQHQRTRGRENWLHTVGKRSPSEPKRWQSILQKQGYRSIDPRLIEDGMLKSIRNRLAIENIAKFHDRFAVPGVPDKLTAAQAHENLLHKGLDPEHYEVAHLGKVFHGITDRAVGGADMLHLDLNPLDHARSLGELVSDARGVDPADSTKGAQIYPQTALNELQGSLSGTKLANRAYGQAKGRLSSLMLGTNPAWATTMSAVTYPFQALMGGARPWDFPASAKWYRGLSEGDKRSFDLQTGTDSPFRSTHEVRAEKVGSSAKALAHHPKLDGLVSTMKLFRQSPFGTFLHNNRPDRIVLALERVPRRYSRIAVASKHVKGMALEKMLTEAKGVQAAQSRLERSMLRLKTVGRMPSEKYMGEVLKSKPHMEEVAKRTSAMMGEWQKMTNFERNVISKVPMFYPWVRYSINLATKALPQTHPIAYALAGQLGTLSREDMRRLLGTDTPTGKAPIGRAQGGEPAEREYDWAGASQADPLLNQITSLVSGTPAGVAGVLPPFIGAPIEYAMNRNSFTDKPLKRSEPYKYGAKEEGRPPFLSTMAAKGLETLAPGRLAQSVASKGQPQAANSLPWALAPMHYSPRIEQSIEEETQAKRKAGARSLVGKYAIPLLPHKEPGLLKAKLERDEKQKKSEEEREGGIAGW